jgi:hypothetical protein
MKGFTISWFRRSSFLRLTTSEIFFFCPILGQWGIALCYILGFFLLANNFKQLYGHIVNIPDRLIPFINRTILVWKVLAPIEGVRPQ